MVLLLWLLLLVVVVVAVVVVLFIGFVEAPLPGALYLYITVTQVLSHSALCTRRGMLHSTNPQRTYVSPLASAIIVLLVDISRGTNFRHTAVSALSIGLFRVPLLGALFV